MNDDRHRHSRPEYLLPNCILLRLYVEKISVVFVNGTNLKITNFVNIFSFQVPIKLLSNKWIPTDLKGRQEWQSASRFQLPIKRPQLEVHHTITLQIFLPAELLNKPLLQWVTTKPTTGFGILLWTPGKDITYTFKLWAVLKRWVVSSVMRILNPVSLFTGISAWILCLHAFWPIMMSSSLNANEKILESAPVGWSKIPQDKMGNVCKAALYACLPCNCEANKHVLSFGCGLKL